VGRAEPVACDPLGYRRSQTIGKVVQVAGSADLHGELVKPVFGAQAYKEVRVPGLRERRWAKRDRVGGGSERC